jgi:4-amino-4-deoxy-L-arabinose transferase-like glycosyltransferase
MSILDKDQNNKMVHNLFGLCKSINKTFLLIIFLSASNLLLWNAILGNALFFSTGLTVHFDEVARNLKGGKGFVVNVDNLAEVSKWQIEHQKLLDTSKANLAKTESWYPEIYSGPGYSILLCLTYFIKHSYQTIRVIQGTFFIISCLLIYFIVKELFDDKTATVASLLMAINPFIAANTLKILPEAIVPFTLVIAIFLCMRGTKFNSPKWFVSSGVVMGISILLRPDIMLLPIFCLLLLLSKSVYWKHIAVLIVSAYLLIVPWTVRNYLVFHKFAPIGAGTGIVMMEGIGAVDKKLGDVGDDEKLIAYEKFHFPFEGNEPFYYNSDPIGRDRLRLKKVFTAIMNNPIWYLKVLIKKALKLIGQSTVNLFVNVSAPTKTEFNTETGNAGYLAYIKAYPIVGIAKLCARLFEWGIIFLGILGIYFSRKFWRLLLTVLIIPIYYIVIQINFYPSLFYYFPMYPFILTFSALSVRRIWQYLLWNRYRVILP